MLNSFESAFQGNGRSRDWRQSVQRAVLVLGGVLIHATAQAGLFEDEEARKAILDLRGRVEQNAQSAKSGLDELRSENEQLRRSLLQLNSLIDQLRTDQAQQRGALEQVARDLAETQRQQKGVQQGLDERLRQLEPVKVSVDGAEFTVEASERKQYEAALNQFRAGDFVSAEEAFLAFARRYPQSGYMPVALFWLANAQYANKHFKEAAVNFLEMIRLVPQHPKAPEALLSAANCQLELKETRAARKTLEDLRSKYPQSEAAAAATERLKKLK